MLEIGRKILWTQDWLRRFRSEQTLSVETTYQDHAAIANQQSNLEEEGFQITTHDEENDLVVIFSNGRRRSSDPLRAEAAPSLGGRLCTNPQREADDFEDIITSQASAQLLELCGRGDHNHSFCDFRSTSQAKKRDKATGQKYYNFRHVKPGDVGALHYEPVDFLDTDRKILSERPKIIMTKTELYRQAQLWPRPPKYHRRHIDKIYGTLSNRVDIRREERKHGKAILEDHLRDIDTNPTSHRHFAPPRLQ